MARLTIVRALPIFASALGLVLLLWGFALNLIGHESAQSWSLIGVGAATFGSSGVSWEWRRRRGSQ